MARVSPGDVDAIGAASHAISEAMRFAPVPDSVREEVARRYEELAHGGGEPAPPVAVRSSAIGEDSQDATFAGQQETYLWVREVDHVCDAIRDCWVSLYSAPAISYRARLGRADEEPAMGVTVQLMVDAAVSRRDVHVQPGQRRSEHGRDQRELGARAGGRRRRGHARRLPRQQGHAGDRARARQQQARRVRPRRRRPRRGPASTSPADRREIALPRRRGASRRSSTWRAGSSALRLPPGRRVGDRARRLPSCSSCSRGR